MTFLPFRPIEMVAVAPAQGVWRRWRVAAYRDLFGDVLIETSWGRIGAPGTTLVKSFADDTDAGRYVRALLRRRATARAWIGWRIA